METAALIAELRDPRSFGTGTEEVGFLQTHVSLLFFAGERVYKLKKPVDLGFLDFTTLERRRHFCEEEVRLNRRLAPGVYLGVVPITRDPEGHLRVGGEGEPLEWAVEMVRLPKECMLEHMLEAGAIDNAMMNDLARLLARFHASAATGEGVDEHGSPEAVRRNVEENFEALASFAGSEAGVGSPPALCSPLLLDHLRGRALSFLRASRGLFERRVRGGRIRDGHGDLHASNVCYRPGGVVAYDCVEFSDRYRCGDVAADLAFLAMDLDRRGFPAFSSYLVKRYAREAEDSELVLLADFYKAYRAVVRGKVAALSTRDRGLDEAERRRKGLEAMDYLQLAAGYDLPPLVVLCCGLPASGKSWLAERLARPLRAQLLQSDVRRKLVEGLRPQARARGAWGQGLYTLAKREATYRSLLGGVRDALAAGRSVILDASFSRRSFRAPFLELARELEAPLLLVLVQADEALTRERMGRRAHDPEAVSDADLEIWRHERDAFEPPGELEPGTVLSVASESEPAEVTCGRLLDAAIGCLRARD